MLRHLSRACWRSRNPRVLAGVGILCLTACGGNGSVGPTAPTALTPTLVPAAPAPTPVPGEQLLALTLSCQAALIIGERTPCIAVASFSSGRQPLVSFESTWSSSRPDVVAVDSRGTSTGKAAGEASVTASYQGRQATSVIVVTEEDALRIASGQADQGAFTPGSTVTLWLQGYYSVASAPTGRLSLRISDQTGTITTTAALTVHKGGDSFLLSSTFVVPDTSVEVCRTAVLEVGAVTIAEPQSKTFPLWCRTIRR
jgi:hypothetical protein